MNIRWCLSFCISLFVLLINAGPSLRADESITAYFRNDSVNGLKISDAYETHNMGILWKKDGFFFELDLGIVSPDMHIYKNQYRVANRSFGEIITLTYGKSQRLNENIDIDYYFKLKGSGTYGIDGLQDLAHKILGLQPVNQVNDLVRMPNATWAGVGGEYRNSFKSADNTSRTLGIQFYLGNDKAEIAPFFSGKLDYEKYILSGEIGLNFIQFDKIISAPPISADHREVIPYIELGLDFEYLGVNWFVRDRFSLPTLAADDNLFGVLSAGIEFNLE